MSRLRTLIATGAVLVICALGCVASAAVQEKFTFDQERTGDIPPGWSAHQQGAGTTLWHVVQGDDSSGRVLAQLATENPNKHFNLAVYDRLELKNVELTVRWKAVSGKLDQGGGFVWRYRDEANHYIVRANPLEDNVVLYKMEAGVRSDLPLLGKGRTYGAKVKKLGTAWHTLKLKAVENEFTVWLDGEELFRVQDNTFAEPGKVGLWTKADAVTWFDDFQIAEP